MTEPPPPSDEAGDAGPSGEGDAGPDAPMVAADAPAASPDASGAGLCCVLPQGNRCEVTSVTCSGQATIMDGGVEQDVPWTCSPDAGAGEAFTACTSPACAPIGTACLLAGLCAGTVQACP